MALQFIAKDPSSDSGDCPAVWVDRETQELVVQGWRADDAMLAQCLEANPIADRETVVRLPARMVAALREACDVAERPTVH